MIKTFLVFYMGICLSINGQETKTYTIHTIAFYNLENLFDTINDPEKFDEESPIMKIKSNKQRIYQKKIRNMARVISEIGYDEAKNSPALIGVCEVENREVLEDLINDSLLINKNYGVIHFSSPDTRGVDVALLYQKQLFIPTNSNSHELKLYVHETQKRVFTRDQLLVSGYLDGELIHTIVNHWPSRRGGQAKSENNRIEAAKLSKRLVDSLQTNNPYAKIFILGDLNDNPTNIGLKKILKTEKDKNKLGLKAIYNPFEYLFEKGYGTTAFNDKWGLFDQILLTEPLLKKDYESFQFYKAGIYNKPYLTNKSGNNKDYPFRSWSNEGFSNGFSDHYPVYVYVIKKSNK